MLPTANIGRTYTQALTGTPTLAAIPAGDVDYAELWVSSAAGFNVRFSASDPGFPLAAATVYRLPIQRTALPLFDGSGTLSLMPLGYGGKAGWTG